MKSFFKDISLLKSLAQKDYEKVNLFIIGEQKCGTTSLHSLLIKNKKILAGARKECQYFNREQSQTDKNYKYYHALFKHQFNKSYNYLIDATPDYLSTNGVSQKLYKYNSKAKIIISLRNPAKRFISAYNFYYSTILNDLESFNKHVFKYSDHGRKLYDYLKNNKNKTLEEFLEDELSYKSPLNCLGRGNYYKNIKEWNNFFPKENICVLFFENLMSEDKYLLELNILKKFLDIDLNAEFPKENVSPKKTDVNPLTLKFLQDFYINDTKELKSLIERDIPW